MNRSNSSFEPMLILPASLKGQFTIFLYPAGFRSNHEYSLGLYLNNEHLYKFYESLHLLNTQVVEDALQDNIVSNLFNKVYDIKSLMGNDEFVTADSDTIINFIADKIEEDSPFAIINTSTMGLIQRNILDAVNILGMEDEIGLCLLDKAGKSSAAFTSRFSRQVCEGVLTGKSLESQLSAVEQSFFWIVKNELFTARNLQDFQELYRQLSPKAKFPAINKARYEEMTELFIEYKDLLK